MISVLIMIVISMFALMINVLFGALAHLHLLDGAILAMIAAVGCHKALNLHPALCIVLFVVVMLGVMVLQNFRVSFWIMSTVFSIGYGSGLAWAVYDEWNDMIWAVVAGGAMFGVSLVLHWLHCPQN